MSNKLEDNNIITAGEIVTVLRGTQLIIAPVLIICSCCTHGLIMSTGVTIGGKPVQDVADVHQHDQALKTVLSLLVTQPTPITTDLITATISVG